MLDVIIALLEIEEISESVLLKIKRSVGLLSYTTEHRSYLKNFENTDADFDDARFELEVVVG